MVKWWNGPEWLMKVKEYWPSNENACEEVPEVKSVVAKSSTIFSYDILIRYTYWRKLIRVIAYCLRFIVNCRNKQRISEKKLSTNGRTDPLFDKELEEARFSSLRLVQEEHFSN